MRTCKRPGLITRLINYLLKDTNLMATVEEVMADVTELTSTLSAVDLKLDEIAVFIANLQSGSVVTQEQLNALAALTSAAKASAAAVLTETDNLDNPA